MDRRKMQPQLQLVPLEARHAEAMYRWMCDPDVRDNVGVRSEPSLARTCAWIEQATKDASVAPFAIELAGKHVGNVVIDRIDTHLATCRLSIYVGEPAARGKGVGRAAVEGAVHHAFQTLALNKVWLTVHVHNAPAIAAYVAAGFAVEGILRDEFVLRGKRCAAFYMSILKQDHDVRKQAA
jgi:RimJ/RimL family protein N-acetyltransferase